MISTLKFLSTLAALGVLAWHVGLIIGAISIGDPGLGLREVR